MTALTDAARDLAAERDRITAYLVNAGLSTPRATANVDRLIAAVRKHAVVKAEAEVHGCCDECNAAMRIARSAILPTRCACEQHTDNETCLGPA